MSHSLAQYVLLAWKWIAMPAKIGYFPQFSPLLSNASNALT